MPFTAVHPQKDGAPRRGIRQHYSDRFTGSPGPVAVRPLPTAGLHFTPLSCSSGLEASEASARAFVNAPRSAHRYLSADQRAMSSRIVCIAKWGGGLPARDDGPRSTSAKRRGGTGRRRRHHIVFAFWSQLPGMSGARRDRVVHSARRIRFRSCRWPWGNEFPFAATRRLLAAWSPPSREWSGFTKRIVSRCGTGLSVSSAMGTRC